MSEGIVQDVMKITQTEIHWSQAQVLVDCPEKQTLIRIGEGFLIGLVAVVNPNKSCLKRYMH